MLWKNSSLENDSAPKAYEQFGKERQQDFRRFSTAVILHKHNLWKLDFKELCIYCIGMEMENRTGSKSAWQIWLPLKSKKGFVY